MLDGHFNVRENQVVLHHLFKKMRKGQFIFLSRDPLSNYVNDGQDPRPRTMLNLLQTPAIRKIQLTPAPGATS